MGTLQRTGSLVFPTGAAHHPVAVLLARNEKSVPAGEIAAFAKVRVMKGEQGIFFFSFLK